MKRVICGVLAPVLFVSQLALPPRAEASSLGSSTASAGSAPPPSLSAIQSFQPDLFTGRATTSIPIIVPPGRKGMQPALALAYSSAGRNSWVGTGWSLDVGYIERSTKNGVPGYNSQDTFTFMFQGIASDLVQIPDGTYRAKDEGLFLRVENHGVSGWEVRDTSGTRYLFGQDADSQIQEGGRIFRWCLTKTIDTHGNTMSFSYTKEHNQLYLSQIRYTGHEPTGVAPANRVDFLLEPRPDIETSYRSGFSITTAKRLRAIEAKATVNGALSLARRYELTYAQSRRTGRPLLTSVTQVGSDGATRLPPVTLTYQDADVPSYTVSGSTPSISVAAWNLRKADLDTGHENFGCVHPYSGIPWGSPVVVTSSADLGCVNATVGSDGSITVHGCQDHFMHAWTWVYTSQPTSLSMSDNGAEACVWREDADGIQRFDGGGSVSVSLQAGWSIIHLTGYHQHDGWTNTMSTPLKSVVEIMSPSQFIKPQLAGDVDGNGITDLIRFDAINGTWTVSCARGCAFSPDAAWLSGFGSSASIPLLGDWNGDGRTDLAIVTNGSWRFATSTATSFQADAIPSLSLGGTTPFTGDFNGDGLTDVGTYDNGTWSIALSTGNGFSHTGSFGLNWGSSGLEPITGDFNGDGLTDIGLVEKSSGHVSVICSNGTSFLPPATAWISGFGPNQAHTSADFNGDGLSDVAYYDKSSGQVRYAPSMGTQFASPVALPPTFALRGNDDGLQAGDFNGDGLADPAIVNGFTGRAELANSQGTFPDLLVSIDNGVGGMTSIEYQASTQCDNTCPIQGVPMLPFIIPVVRKVTLGDGMGHSYATTYVYRHGRYDAPSKEFRGFGRVEVRDPDANVAVTEFLQDDERKGRPSQTEFSDASGTLWTRTEQTWSTTTPFPGVRFTKLDQTDTYTFDGDATSRHTRSRIEYDEYGNVITATGDGAVETTGDERASRTTYAPNVSAWILNKPSLTQTLDANGTVVAQRRFSYDGAASADAPPTAGTLTKEEEWLSGPTGEQWLPTALTYDPYGNVKTVTDALDRTTTNTYDADANTYLVQIENHLGHTRRLAYDPRSGQVTTSTDQNEVTTTTTYDALGRVVKIIGPTDTDALPTVEYEYHLSSVPTATVTHTRVQSGSPLRLTHYTFHNGLGQTVQVRSPAEDASKQVVTGNIEFNARGLVTKQWVPYLSDSSSSYRPLSLEPAASSLATVSYTYDPLGRLLTAKDPDGSTTTTAYDDWVVTVTDASGHQTRRTNDAYGRLIAVEEFNEGQTYTTTYAYDALNALTQVTDAKGHVTRITYDSLGRKRSMDDPDMGQWTYVYDRVDNLVQQTDARGVAITFTYDALNRLTGKSYADTPLTSHLSPITYTYDDPAKPFANGKLTRITDGSGSSSFEYDNLGRLVKEEKIIDGTRFTVHRAYDLVGRLTSLTYPSEKIATYTYNPQGGLETVSLQSPASSLQPIVTHASYNAAGQLVTIAYGNGVTTDYTYDPQTLRLNHLITQSPNHQPLQDFAYQFDAVGNVKQIVDGVHTGTQHFEYDDLNRLTLASGAYGNMTYRYDPLGNMLEKEGAQMSYGEHGAGPHAVTSVSGLQPSASSLELRYDANGNLISKAPSQSLNHSITQSQYSYDAENRLVSVTTPQEDTVTVDFKPGWNFFSLPVIPAETSIAALFPNFSADFEQIARLAPNPQPPTQNQFQHYVNNAPFDDFSSLDYGVGYEVYAKHEATVTFTGALPTQRLSQSLVAGWHLLPAISTQHSALSQTFGGLDADQILGLDAASQTLTPATETQAASAYFVHLAKAQTFAPSLPRDPTTRFLYDGDGGRVKQITAKGTTTYLGELFEQDPTGKTIEYVFAGGLRLAAIETPQDVTAKSQQTTKSQQERGETSCAFAGFRAFAVMLAKLFGTDTAEAATGSTLYFYHPDHLGSSNLVTDATGAIVEHTEYTPYGSKALAPSPQPPAHSAFGFTGQRQDTTNGLILFPARAYDPQLGRFLQPDPFVQDPSDPQTLNRYSYVRNNPVRFVDPSGYGFWNWFFGFYFAAAAIVLFVVAGVSFLTGNEPGAAAAFNYGLQAAAISAANFHAAVNDTGNSFRGPPGVPEDADSLLQSNGPTLLQSPTSRGASGPALPTEAAIAAADLPLEPSWGPDDAIYALIGIGVAAKAAAVAARELGPAAWAGLRSLASETGAVRIGAGKEIEELAEREIIHFTNTTGRNTITRSGVLRKGTFVTRPSEIPAGASRQQVKEILELRNTTRARHALRTTVQETDLAIPSNGPTTSRGAWQRVLKRDMPIDPNDFKTYGRQ